MSNIHQAIALRLDPVRSIEGILHLPGSKSISNRALILSALAEGETKISNLLDADDVTCMLSALERLHVEYCLSMDRSSCVIKGNGGPFSNNAPITLDLGNAGTAMRPLCAVLTLGVGEFILTGDARMQERPIGDLVQSLQQAYPFITPGEKKIPPSLESLDSHEGQCYKERQVNEVNGCLQAGATIQYLEKNGFPPVKILANQLHGGKISVKADISSQFLTALLMALPLAISDSVLSIEGRLVSKPYIDMTLQMIKQFGGKIENKNDQQFFIPGRQRYLSPGIFHIEGDASAASYFLAAAAIRGKVNVHGLTQQSIQGDIQFLDVLKKMGAQVTFKKETITVQAAKLRSVDMDLNHIPDAAMTVAVLALFAEGKTVIRNIGNWRVKETDRLNAMATELRKVGAIVEEGSDYLSILPPTQIKHAVIDTYNDHRMAMCFSLLALSDQGITINNPGCVSKTFPNFFEDFASITVAN